MEVSRRLAFVIDPCVGLGYRLTCSVWPVGMSAPCQIDEYPSLTLQELQDAVDLLTQLYRPGQELNDVEQLEIQ